MSLEGLVAGAMYQMAGEYDRAAQAYAGVMAASPDNPEALFLFGTLCLIGGNFSLAGQRFAQAARLAPDRPSFLCGLGLLHHLRGEGEAALICLDRAAAGHPPSPSALYQLAHLLAAFGEMPAATEFAREASRMGSPEAAVLLSSFDGTPAPRVTGGESDVDVLVVVHNGLEFVRPCFESVLSHTRNFRIFVWDNGSAPSTAGYSEELSGREEVRLVRCETNQGFIRPNNALAALGHAPNIVLLNSDTVVRPGWESRLSGFLRSRPGFDMVGYEGGLLDGHGRGVFSWVGAEIDYVCGWCVCLRRSVYDRLGLFDETNFSFAYGEDSDLSLRVREAGGGIAALFRPAVDHLGRKTAIEVDRTTDFAAASLANLAWLERRWGSYLHSDQVLVRTANRMAGLAVQPDGQP